MFSFPRSFGRGLLCSALVHDVVLSVGRGPANPNVARACAPSDDKLLQRAYQLRLRSSSGDTSTHDFLRTREREVRAPIRQPEGRLQAEQKRISTRCQVGVRPMRVRVPCPSTLVPRRAKVRRHRMCIGPEPVFRCWLCTPPRGRESSQWHRRSRQTRISSSKSEACSDSKGCSFLPRRSRV